MVWNRRVVLNLIFLVLLALIFFTPVGKFFQKQIGKLTEQAPQSETLVAEHFDVELKGFNTKDVNLADLKGNVIFLNFWGTWCPPCVQEMPSIQKLYDSKGKEVKFVLIAMQEKPEQFLPFLKKNGYTMPVYQAKSLMNKALKPDVFPTTYILDKQGNIVLKVDKTKDWNSPEVHQLLDELLQKV